MAVQEEVSTRPYAVSGFQPPAIAASGRVFIYTLSHPITNEVRYVGKTINLKERLQGHLEDKGPTYKRKWISKLKREGLIPVIEVLEEFQGEHISEWQQAERFWIETLRFYGCRLTNACAGGIDGNRYPPEVRLKMSLLKKGKPLPLNHKSRIKGKVASAETRLKISIAGMGRKWTESQRQKIIAARKGLVMNVGHKHSEESKRKMSVAMLGKNKGKKWSAVHRHKVALATWARIRAKALGIPFINPNKIKVHD